MSFVRAGGSRSAEGGYAIYEVVLRVDAVLRRDGGADQTLRRTLNDPDAVVPATEAQGRVWTALRKDLDRLGAAHGMEF